MIKVSIFYPNDGHGKFDFEYYMQSYTALAEKLLAPALKLYSVDYGLRGVTQDSDPPFHIVEHFLFDSIEAFCAVFTPCQEELQRDRLNYTDSKVLIQISEQKFLEAF
jgi:uncharacterized protein (TIGR02118 family)